MDLPLHPLVVSEIARGREFLDQIRTARRNIEALQVSVNCPDGENTIVFGGDGMVVDAHFAPDLFTRHPGDALNDLLLAMTQQGYAQVSQKVSAHVAAILEQP